ncbi:MAG: NAD-dependent epimerase/dehydratase family protein [Candidatus Promineifilaceae bacterium]
MAERVLVTGGAGFIGSHLVDALCRAGHKVRVLDNLEPQVHAPEGGPAAWPAYANGRAEYRLGDVRDVKALGSALQDVQVVYHLAARVGVGQSMYEIEKYVDVNSRGTAVLLDLLANDARLRREVRKLVVASSMSVYGEGSYCCSEHGEQYPGLRPPAQLAERKWEPGCLACGRSLQPAPTNEDKPLQASSIYAISKRDQEEMCLAFGRAYSLPVVALRFFNTYGSRQALSNPYTGVAAIFCGRLLNGQPPVLFEDGRQLRDFVHVSDAVQALELVASREEADFNVYNVGAGRALSVLEVAELLIGRLGSACRPEVVARFRAGDIRHCFADISRLGRLGYRPRVAFGDGLGELVAWVQAQSAADTFGAAQEELYQRGLAQ